MSVWRNAVCFAANIADKDCFCYDIIWPRVKLPHINDLPTTQVLLLQLGNRVNCILVTLAID